MSAEPQPAAKAAVPAPAAPRRRWTRGRKIRWAVRIAVLLVLIGYPLGVGFDGWFYYPSDKRYEQPADYRLECAEVRFRTADGLTLAGWFLPATAPRCHGTVVHFHGNAANISAHIGLVAWLPAAGFNVLEFDYRGYGDSQGRPDRAGLVRDGHAALDYVLARPDLRGRPVFVYGQSLGAAVAVVVAAQRPEVAAVVAESPFDSYRAVAARQLERLVFVPAVARGIAALTVSAGNDPVDCVAQLAPRPLLVIVAGADELCVPELGSALYERAAPPKEFWSAPGAAHLGILDDNADELMRRITTFLRKATSQ